MPRRSWTDDDLRAAVAHNRTWAEVLRELGASRGGTTHAVVKRRAEDLGLDTGHVRNGTGGAARRTWTDDDLRAAVRASSNLRQVFVALGLQVGGGSWVAMKRHVTRLGLDTTHWTIPLPEDGRLRPRVPLPVWTDEEVVAAFDGALSLAEVMRRLGLDPLRKRGRGAVEHRLDRLGLDRASLPGQPATGRRVPLRRRFGRRLEEVLVENSTYTSTSHLKLRLIREGYLLPRCGRCRITEWFGLPAPLQLDHSNGDRTDNRIQNLRLLCPNCHAQTDTYCGRNIGRG